MNPELLASFLAVYRQQSFTRAAEQVERTQSAVSRQIQQLEEQVGVALFERLGKTVVPTDAGNALVPLAEQLLGQIDRVAETVRSYAGTNRGTLRIGASTTPGYYWLPPVLGKFHARYPGVDLHLSVANSRTIEQRIHHNELDIGFVGARLTSESLMMERIADDEIVCVCGPVHPLRHGRNVTRATLSGATWIVREKGSATRELFQKHLVKLGIKLNQLIELDSPEGIKALVRAGLGISFLSIHAVAAELRRRELRRIRFEGIQFSRPLYLVRHPNKYISIAMQRFIELLPKSARAVE